MPLARRPASPGCPGRLSGDPPRGSGRLRRPDHLASQGRPAVRPRALRGFACHLCLPRERSNLISGAARTPCVRRSHRPQHMTAAHGGIQLLPSHPPSAARGRALRLIHPRPTAPLSPKVSGGWARGPGRPGSPRSRTRDQAWASPQRDRAGHAAAPARHESPAGPSDRADRGLGASSRLTRPGRRDTLRR